MSDKYDKIVEVAVKTICTEVSRIEKERMARAHNLKKLRDKRGYSQSKLAELSGVSLRMIQYYEQGANDINTAQAETVYRLAQALECNMEDLLEVTI
jgi:DNA-binding Xre family transcriptional regulator